MVTDAELITMVTDAELITWSGAGYVLFQIKPLYAIFGAVGVLLSACYGLLLYKKVILGELIKENLKRINDLSLREKFCLYPLVLLIIIFGIYPKPILETYSVTVANYLQTLN